MENQQAMKNFDKQNKKQQVNHGGFILILGLLLAVLVFVMYRLIIFRVEPLSLDFPKTVYKTQIECERISNKVCSVSTCETNCPGGQGWKGWKPTAKELLVEVDRYRDFPYYKKQGSKVEMDVISAKFVEQHPLLSENQVYLDTPQNGQIPADNQNKLGKCDGLMRVEGEMSSIGVDDSAIGKKSYARDYLVLEKITCIDNFIEPEAWYTFDVQAGSLLGYLINPFPETLEFVIEFSELDKEYVVELKPGEKKDFNELLDCEEISFDSDNLASINVDIIPGKQAGVGYGIFWERFDIEFNQTKCTASDLALKKNCFIDYSNSGCCNYPMVFDSLKDLAEERKIIWDLDCRGVECAPLVPLPSAVYEKCYDLIGNYQEFEADFENSYIEVVMDKIDSYNYCSTLADCKYTALTASFGCGSLGAYLNKSVNVESLYGQLMIIDEFGDLCGEQFIGEAEEVACINNKCFAAESGKNTDKMLGVKLELDAPFSYAVLDIQNDGKVLYSEAEFREADKTLKANGLISQANLAEITRTINEQNFEDMEDRGKEKNSLTDGVYYYITVQYLSPAENPALLAAYPQTVKCYEGECSDEFMAIWDLVIKYWGQEMKNIGV